MLNSTLIQDRYSDNSHRVSTAIKYFKSFKNSINDFNFINNPQQSIHAYIMKFNQ